MATADKDFLPELSFKSTRSSGPGGQNVNKVSSRVELRFNVSQSLLLTDAEKSLVLKKLSNRINQDGELILEAQDERSMIRNKSLVVGKFLNLIEQALKVEKKRYKTKPTRASVEKRLESKRVTSAKKAGRKLENPE